MAFIHPCHRSPAYGDGTMQTEGALGHLVCLVGHDLFAVNTDPKIRSFGILINHYAAGVMPGMYCQGGVYETDVFAGTIHPGDDLKVSADGQLTGGTISDGEQIVAQAIAVHSGVLKFQLLI